VSRLYDKNNKSNNISDPSEISAVWIRLKGKNFPAINPGSGSGIRTGIWIRDPESGSAIKKRLDPDPCLIRIRIKSMQIRNPGTHKENITNEIKCIK
jgi:hypothetical protein